MDRSTEAVNATLDTIEVMRRQEDSAYLVTDYLAQIPSAAALEAPVDASCRFAMAKWCNEIADFCNYNRETSAVALNCLDRFMATPAGREILFDRNQFQLAAMTALYTAVKIHEHEAMDPKLVSTLSRNAHSSEAVEAMETKMLNAIQWRVNPPTALSFVRNMIDTVPEHLIDATERETIMELTVFQLDLSICDYRFSRAPASSLAFASLLNAVDSVVSDGMFFTNFENTMSGVIHVDHNSLRDIRIALYEAVNGTEDAMDIQNYITDPSENKGMEDYAAQGNVHCSPRSVNA
jgi:hypothetical protein